MKKIYQDKGIRMLKNRQSRERANKILPLLQECKTDREVSERLGYVSPDSVYCYIHQHKLREKTTVTPAPKRGRLPFPPRNRQNRPLPHNRPFAIPPKKQSPPQREFRFGNGRDGLFRSINRGKRSRGSPPVWIYPSKTSFTGCNFTALSTLKAEIQPIIFFLYMSLDFPPKKFKTFLAI